MRYVVSILITTVALEFYKANVVFFLVAFGFCFGILSGAEHLALATAFTNSWWLLLVPTLLALVYAITILLFNRSLLTSSAYLFIFNAGAMPTYELSKVLTPVCLLQLAPASIYFLFLLIVALKSHQPAIGAFCVGYIILLHVAAIHRLRHWISNPEVLRTSNRVNLRSLLATFISMIMTYG